MTESPDPDTNTFIIFGWRNLFLTTQHWIERHLAGRIQGTTNEMTAAINRAANTRGRDFEDYVADQARAAGCPYVRVRVKRIAGTNLRQVDGKDLGDVDVLLVTPAGDIVVIEAKALVLARTPRELKSEMDKLTNDRNAATTRAQERVDHLQRHHRAVEDDLDLEHDPHRTFRPLVVTDLPLIGTYLNATNVPITAVANLNDHL